MNFKYWADSRVGFVGGILFVDWVSGFGAVPALDCSGWVRVANMFLSLGRRNAATGTVFIIVGTSVSDMVEFMAVKALLDLD